MCLCLVPVQVGPIEFSQEILWNPVCEPSGIPQGPETSAASIWLQRGSKARLKGQPHKGGNRKSFVTFFGFCWGRHLDFMRKLYFRVSRWTWDSSMQNHANHHRIMPRIHLQTWNVRNLTKSLNVDMLMFKHILSIHVNKNNILFNICLRVKALIEGETLQREHFFWWSRPDLHRKISP